MALLEVPGLFSKAKFPFGNDLKAHILPSKSKRNQSKARKQIRMDHLYYCRYMTRTSFFLFYGSTIQKSICDTPPCNTIEAARRVGEKLVSACVYLNIQEISACDRNGYAHGEKMQAFEIATSQYGFLPC